MPSWKAIRHLVWVVRHKADSRSLAPPPHKRHQSEIIILKPRSRRFFPSRSLRFEFHPHILASLLLINGITIFPFFYLVREWNKTPEVVSPPPKSLLPFLWRASQRICAASQKRLAPPIYRRNWIIIIKALYRLNQLWRRRCQFTRRAGLKEATAAADSWYFPPRRGGIRFLINDIIDLQAVSSRV